MQIQQAEASRSKAQGEEMQVEQAEARHTERKCGFSKRRRARRQGHADLAGGSGRGKKQMQI